MTARCSCIYSATADVCSLYNNCQVSNVKALEHLLLTRTIIIKASWFLNSLIANKLGNISADVAELYAELNGILNCFLSRSGIFSSTYSDIIFLLLLVNSGCKIDKSYHMNLVINGVKEQSRLFSCS